MTARRYFILIIAAALFYISGCGETKTRSDYSNTPIDTRFLHLEKDFRKLKNIDGIKKQDSLKTIYGDFIDLYIQSILGLGERSDSGFHQKITTFLNDTSVQLLLNTIDTEFVSTQTTDAEIRHGLQGLKKNLPDFLAPDVVYLMSGLRYNVVLSDSVLGIGLDLYLGPESVIYEKAGVPHFRRDRSEPERIPYDALRGWLMSEIEMPDYRLIDHIIQYGKALIILDELYPDIEKEYLAGYTAAEWKWCVENEAWIWATLIESNSLFSKKGEDVRKYTADGPFTKGFPRESPSRLAAFIGWQMMRSYLNRNNVTWSELLALGAPEILNNSNYKPE